MYCQQSFAFLWTFGFMCLCVGEPGKLLSLISRYLITRGGGASGSI